MVQKLEKIDYGKYYHIYNCGINACAIFKENSNYEHFLRLYEKYIDTVADTFAWVLMGNHFHIFVRIKSKDEIGWYKDLKLSKNYNEDKFIVIQKDDESFNKGLKRPNPLKHFSHLFNAYARYFNRKYQRHGALFERPFRRKKVVNINYFKNLVLYIHNNPVHHGYCDHPMEYAWSSYLTCVSLKPTKLKRDFVIAWFNDKSNFKDLHDIKIDLIGFEQWLGI